MRLQFAATAMAMILLATPGCVPNDPATSSTSSITGDASMNAAAAWPFWPAKMTIHPLTRYIIDTDTGRPMLEARIEFQDAQGHRSKAVGVMVIQLADASPPDDGSAAMHEWTREFRNIQENQQHFDIVTRTYVIRLDVEADLLPTVGELRVIFDSINGVVMEASTTIRLPQ